MIYAHETLTNPVSHSVENLLINTVVVSVLIVGFFLMRKFRN